MLFLSAVGSLREAIRLESVFSQRPRCIDWGHRDSSSLLLGHGKTAETMGRERVQMEAELKVDN